MQFAEFESFDDIRTCAFQSKSPYVIIAKKQKLIQPLLFIDLVYQLLIATN